MRDWIESTARRAAKAWVKFVVRFLPIAGIFAFLRGGSGSSDPSPFTDMSKAEVAAFVISVPVSWYVGAFVLTGVAPDPDKHPERYLYGWALAWITAVLVIAASSLLVTGFPSDPEARHELWVGLALFSGMGAICGPIYGAHALDWRFHEAAAARRKERKNGSDHSR